ncbi:MAG TPA: SHOCT domain-containing protein [Acidimicrobiia bacterium]|nr:SHOCT domain-containing protein [Acidimicrobiia bacterium]
MPLLDLFWAMLWFFLFFIWLMLLFRIFGDIFRSDDMGGWAKAFWTLFVVILPVLGVLVYVIARGKGMAERDISQYQAAEAAQRQYIKEAAGASSPADEIAKLAALRDRGVLSAEEFEAQKAALLV